MQYGIRSLSGTSLRVCHTFSEPPDWRKVWCIWQDPVTFHDDKTIYGHYLMTHPEDILYKVHLPVSWWSRMTITSGQKHNFPLKMEAACSFEILVILFQTAVSHFRRSHSNFKLLYETQRVQAFKCQCEKRNSMDFLLFLFYVHILDTEAGVTNCYE